MVILGPEDEIDQAPDPATVEPEDDNGNRSGALELDLLGAIGVGLLAFVSLALTGISATRLRRMLHAWWSPGSPSRETNIDPGHDPPARASAAVAPRPASPTAVEIPAIGVRSELSELGLDETGAIEAPSDFDVAGWFSLGPQPGEPRPAVIAGHVDSQDGPAVFYRLHELAAGDAVTVRRADGNAIRFTVTDAQSYAKTAFPTEAVYGPVPEPEMRIITCGGEFDRSRGQYARTSSCTRWPRPPDRSGDCHGLPAAR